MKGMKPSIAVMIGSGPGKGGADHGDHMEPDADESGGASDSDTDDAVQEEMGNAVAEAMNSGDMKGLYRAICDIVKYERG